MCTIERKLAGHRLDEVSIISSIILQLANSAVNQGKTIDGPALSWLAEQLDKAAQQEAAT